MEKPGKFQVFIEPLKLLYGPDMTKWSDEAKNKAFELFSSQTSPEGAIATSVSGPLSRIFEAEAYERTPEGRKEALAMAREDAREKAKQTLMWSTLAKLPETITRAVNPFGGPEGAAMYYQGISSIPNIYNQTLVNYPQIQVPGSSTQQFRYFN